MKIRALLTATAMNRKKPAAALPIGLRPILKTHHPGPIPARDLRGVAEVHDPVIRRLGQSVGREVGSDGAPGQRVATRAQLAFRGGQRSRVREPGPAGAAGPHRAARFRDGPLRGSGRHFRTRGGFGFEDLLVRPDLIRGAVAVALAGPGGVGPGCEDRRCLAEFLDACEGTGPEELLGEGADGAPGHAGAAGRRPGSG